MSLEKIRTGKLLYHLTKLSNLDSILENGLLSRSLLIEEEIRFSDVADNQIIRKRTRLGLDDYVPFHFHPHSAFDHAVKNTYYGEDFIYICITRRCARNNDFKILPLHPLTTTDECDIYDYDKGFELIDWEAMASKGNQDVYIKNVKMAECLSEDIISVEDFHSIYVGDQEIRDQVIELLEENDLEDDIYVNIAPWAK